MSSSSDIAETISKTVELYFETGKESINDYNENKV